MNKDTAIINFKCIKKNVDVDLEVPLFISPKELLIALNTACGLEIDTKDINNCYLKAENPIVLLKGNRTLREYNIRNGSVIYYTE